MNLSKKELRAAIREQKKAMTPEDIAARSRELCRMALNTDAYRQAETVYGYLPFNQEVDLHPLLQQALSDGKQVALPKCYGNEMRFILTDDLSHIQYTPFGVPEPINNEPLAQDDTALVIVPGLAFDEKGYRIGYGGGYYDRFLALEPNHPTIALCYDFQLFPRLNTDLHDIPVDTVLAI